MSTHAAAIAELANCLYPRINPDGEEWQAVARRDEDQRPRSGARLMQQVERMHSNEKRHALPILDALIEREPLRASKG